MTSTFAAANVVINLAVARAPRLFFAADPNHRQTIRFGRAQVAPRSSPRGAARTDLDATFRLIQMRVNAIEGFGDPAPMRNSESALFVGESSQCLATASRLALLRGFSLQKTTTAEGVSYGCDQRFSLVLLDASEPLDGLVAVSTSLAQARPSPAQVALYQADTPPAVLSALGRAGVHHRIEIGISASEQTQELDRALEFDISALAAHAAGAVGRVSWPRVLQAIRHAMFLEAYSRSGSKSAAARLLGVSRQAVQQELRKIAETQPLAEAESVPASADR